MKNNNNFFKTNASNRVEKTLLDKDFALIEL